MSAEFERSERVVELLRRQTAAAAEFVSAESRGDVAAASKASAELVEISAAVMEIRAERGEQ